ncbi:helix-turn-helix domain-containing protein [Dyella japonica]|uniref:helix-turn-helix domain-containing protein n=1 Tax=Dyella japonica TaxID=231455 RepID=UPI001F232F9B|nr:helix-turn-helix transcriptional regulator [Dyella japonica]
MAAGLSQRVLGINAGLEPSVASARINQYERSTHMPGVGTLANLGLVLDVPLPYFYAEDDALAMCILAFHRGSGAQRRQLVHLAKGINRPKS